MPWGMFPGQGVWSAILTEQAVTGNGIPFGG